MTPTKRGRKIEWTEKRIKAVIKSLRRYIRECYDSKPEVITTENAVRIIPPKLPSMEEFLKRGRLNSNYIYELAKKWPELAETIKKLKDVQSYTLVNYGLNGSYDKTFAIFAAKNLLDWKDKTEQEVIHRKGPDAYKQKLYQRLGVGVN